MKRHLCFKAVSDFPSESFTLIKTEKSIITITLCVLKTQETDETWLIISFFGQNTWTETLCYTYLQHLGENL